MTLISLHCPIINSSRTGCRLMTSLSTMHMKHTNHRISNVFKELSRQLLSEHDAWSNHYNSLRGVLFKLTQTIKDHGRSLTSTSRHNQLTNTILGHSEQTTFLVRTELDHRVHCVWDYYSRKPSLKRLSGRFLKCPSISSSTRTKVV